MTAATAFGMPSGVLPTAPGLPVPPSDRHPTFAVRLIDRRTGAAHRINGRPLILFSRNPEDAISELLDGRDPAVWDARAEQLPQDPRR